MQATTKFVIGAAAGLVVVAGGAGHRRGARGWTTTRVTPRSPGRPRPGQRRRPRAHGRGPVTETEVGDEESFYEVEVTLDDGTQTRPTTTDQARRPGTAAAPATIEGVAARAAEIVRGTAPTTTPRPAVVGSVSSGVCTHAMGVEPTERGG